MPRVTQQLLWVSPGADRQEDTQISREKVDQIRIRWLYLSKNSEMYAQYDTATRILWTCYNTNNHPLYIT